MRHVLATLFAGLFCCGGCASTPPAPVVSQVHVLSVHVKDYAAFDAAFLLFRDKIGLPLLYGEMAKPGSEGKTLYAGFSVGNAYIEPCGPYKNDAPFGPDQPARFLGLTFACAAPIADAARELDRRGIRHSDPFGSGQLRFVYVTDDLLTSRRQAVGLWEILDPSDHANLDFAASALRQAKGGPLGIRRIAEVRVRVLGKERLAQWDRFLAPSRRRADVCRAGKGPSLRLVSGQECEIDSILLEVESLAKAKAVLSERQLLGNQVRGAVELDPAKTLGLRIRLVQGGKKAGR
jgi:hypothetical protein